MLILDPMIIVHKGNSLRLAIKITYLYDGECKNNIMNWRYNILDTMALDTMKSIILTI